MNSPSTASYMRTASIQGNRPSYRPKNRDSLTRTREWLKIATLVTDPSMMQNLRLVAMGLKLSIWSFGQAVGLKLWTWSFGQAVGLKLWTKILGYGSEYVSEYFGVGEWRIAVGRDFGWSFVSDWAFGVRLVQSLFLWLPWIFLNTTRFRVRVLYDSMGLFIKISC